VYFYTVANMLGVGQDQQVGQALGLGVMTGIDLPNEVQGLVPSEQWKQERFHEKWYAGETISVGIGQGAVSVTPISMAVYMATLANGGTRVTPHVLKAVDDGSGSGWKPVPPPPPPCEDRRDAREDAGHSRRTVDGGERRRHRRTRADPGQGRGRQDRHRASDLEREARRLTQRQGLPGQRLVRVLRSA
jgi:membrane peptidoglycan carboxypeptidase